jgi:integrase
MNQSFECVEKHLYRRSYETADGSWSTLYYGIFVDWKGRRRRFPLGDNLGNARDRLGELRRLDMGRYDFDAEKKEREKAKVKAMTLSEWLDRYLSLMKNKPSYAINSAQLGHVKRVLGHLTLSEVTKVRIMEYKQRRLAEPIIRNGKAVEGTLIQGATVNREVSCLVTALNLAAEEGLCDGAPRIKKEREVTRDRILTDKEYRSILDASPRWLARVVIAANETALDRGSLVTLTWDCVKDGLIVLSRPKSGVKQRVAFSPALNDVLHELREEYRRVPNTDKRVFTKKGKPITQAALRHAFDRAVKVAKVEDFQLRDFRHCARTRWASMGLPFEVAEAAMGHKLQGVAGKYINLTDDQVREAFQNCLQGVYTAKQANHAV